MSEWNEYMNADSQATETAQPQDPQQATTKALSTPAFNPEAFASRVVQEASHNAVQEATRVVEQAQLVQRFQTENPELVPHQHLVHAEAVRLSNEAENQGITSQELLKKASDSIREKLNVKPTGKTVMTLDAGGSSSQQGGASSQTTAEQIANMNDAEFKVFVRQRERGY
jgi:hypothetical protein